jgi:hypothetical protein
LVTAWEVIPFSFVIDWFINIGQKIAFLSTQLGHHNDTTHYGVKVELECESKSELLTPNPATSSCYVFDNSSATATVKSTLIMRDRASPSFIPDFVLHLDAFKVADLIALILQALARR